MSLRNFALLLCVTAEFAYPQQDNGSILGTVSDSSGAVVPGASIEIRNVATGQTTKLLSDASGDFFAPVLRVGVYSVAVAANGFRSEVLDNLTLRVADRMKLSIRLEPGAVQETVTVTGMSP